MPITEAAKAHLAEVAKRGNAPKPKATPRKKKSAPVKTKEE
jgi:hypothetical protein